MEKTNELTTPEIINKDIFATLHSLAEIDAEKESLRPEHDIDLLVSNLKKDNLTDESVLKEVTIQVLNTFEEELLVFQELWSGGTLIKDLEQHAILSTYYNIQYLKAGTKKNIDDFLRFSIKELEGMPIQDQKKRILADIKRKQDKWFLPLLNFTETRKKQNISCFLPLIFKSFEYKTDDACNNSQTPLLGYNSAIKYNTDSASSSLTRKLETTIKSINVLYQKIFSHIFTTEKDANQTMSDFFLYYYKLERAYGADLLYNSLIFLRENKSLNISEDFDRNFEKNLQKLTSFLLYMQRLPNIMTRCSYIAHCYQTWKNCFHPLKHLYKFFLKFEKVWLLTIIEYCERDLTTISDKLFRAIKKAPQINDIFSAYKMYYSDASKEHKPVQMYDLFSAYQKQCPVFIKDHEPARINDIFSAYNRRYFTSDNAPEQNMIANVFSIYKEKVSDQKTDAKMVNDILSTYEKEYSASSYNPELDRMYSKQQFIPFTPVTDTSDLPHRLFSSDWELTSPYNYILDSYFKKRYSLGWWTIKLSIRKNGRK